MIEFINENTKKEYEDFIASHPKGHFAQSHLWGRQKSAWEFKAIAVRDSDGKIKGSMAFLIRRAPLFGCSMMYSCRGPVCDLDDEDTFSRLLVGAKILAKRCNAYVIKIDPDVPAENADFAAMLERHGFKCVSRGKSFEGAQPKFVFRLHLDEGMDEAELLLSFSQKTRYNLRKAQKSGVEVRIGTVEDVEDFGRLMLITGHRDGFTVRGAEYFKSMLEIFGENARLYMAYYDGVPIAGTIAIAFGDKVWYLYGASSNEHRDKMPNYLLQWNMIRWALERESRVYDFRGVSGDLSEDNPLYGLYRFKKGFGGRFTEFVGEYDLVLDSFMNLCVGSSIRLYRALRGLLK